MNSVKLALRYALWTIVAAALMGGAGCAGAAPAMFPVSALRTVQRSGGEVERWYDVDRDGRSDFCEFVAPDGRVGRIGYDRNEDGQIDEAIDLARVPADEIRHLLIILDSVPISMVREFQAQGRLGYFWPATQVICPFPVMTDPALVEFFGTAPGPSVEAAYYDGQRLRDGYEVYAAGGNTPWHDHADYHLNTVLHAVAYLSQPEWYGHELRRISEVFTERSRRGERMTVAYVVSTSALGSRRGRDGHALGLVWLDRFCQQMVWQTRGRIRISLMSDHGHNLLPSEWIPLADELERLGYRVGSRLERPGDVAVPEFGVVSCGAIYTHDAACVARDVVHIRGIELSAYCECGDDGADSVVVIGRVGRARITQSSAGFRYVPETGDPLEMVGIIEKLRQQSRVDANGFVADKDLFEATLSHVYPDAVARLWRAFHGLFEHVPDVFVSVEDGFEVGSHLMTTLVHMQSTHGNLRAGSSFGFAASMAGQLPPIMRMADLRAAFERAGVPLRD